MYYKISNNIINNYNNNRNYQILNNTNEFIKYNNIIIKDIKSIINNDNINIQFQNLMNIYYKIKDSKDSNYIIGEIDIKENDVNKEIRIINNNNKALNDQYSDIKYEENEEIEKNCEITIDDKIIPFSFFYKFNQKGKYIIKYLFHKHLTKTNCIFLDCKNLIKLDLSNFETKNVNDMSYMFSCCENLNELNLSNFETKNVNNMNSMFFECKSLKELNLSNFETKNVNNMRSMFNRCQNLKE